MNIQYLHIPGLGINSQLRKNLKTEQDYKNLFSSYEKEILPFGRSELNEIIMNLNTKKRVALTCFEAEPKMCHRYYISSTLQRKNHNLTIKHI